MEQFLSLINLYSEYLIAAILLLFFMALISFFTVVRSLNKAKKQYQTVLKGMSNKNLEEIILGNAQKIEYLEEYMKESDLRLSRLSENLNLCVKNVAVKRYNAFEGVGGEQSFSIALLDDIGNGVILTGIHGRDDARTYAKPVGEGRSKYNLSEEEKLVLSIALNKGLKNKADISNI